MTGPAAFAAVIGAIVAFIVVGAAVAITVNMIEFLRNKDVYPFSAHLLRCVGVDFVVVGRSDFPDRDRVCMVTYAGNDAYTRYSHDLVQLYHHGRTNTQPLTWRPLTPGITRWCVTPGL